MTIRENRREFYGLNFARKIQADLESTSEDVPGKAKGQFCREVHIMFRLIRMCPKCRARIMLRARVGQRITCPECKSVFVAPED